MLHITDLHATAEGRAILKGLTLHIGPGEVHAIMGPNGAGKSTLSFILAGRPEYTITGGQIMYRGQDLLALSPEARAAVGLFLAFQYPVEIPGVSLMIFLKTALNALRRARGHEPLDVAAILDLVRTKAEGLGVTDEMLRRPLNVGFSGGEKKRAEVLQMAVLDPSLCVLDETDSGLDVDALRAVAEGVNALRNPTRSFLVITHYQRLLEHLKPDHVHVMVAGRLKASDGPELARTIEREGYAAFQDSAEAGAA